MASNSDVRAKLRADLSAIYDLWNQGFSLHEISVRVGRSDSWVRDIVRDRRSLSQEQRRASDAPRFRPPEPRAPADRDLHRRIGSTQNVPDGWV